MFLDTQPAPILAGDGMDEFRVSSPVEVLGLLKDLLDSNVQVHLSAPGGASYTTQLWTVDKHQRRITFSADAGAPQLQALVEAGEATAVAYLDSIKLQFDATGLSQISSATSCALRADLPAEVFRFQRRNSFRVRTLPRTAATAHLRHPALPDMTLDLRVLDVSTGGCALFVPHDVPPLAPGVLIQRVRLELDPNTRFECGLQLCHITSLNPETGGVRLGCEFKQLGGEAQRALQRYIDQTQKRRRLLSLD